MNKQILQAFLAMGVILTSNTLTDSSPPTPIPLTTPIDADTDYIYGSDRLENTDPATFTRSMINQMYRVGIFPPLSYEPFPDEFRGLPYTDYLRSYLRGASSQFPFKSLLQDELNLLFPESESCDRLKPSQNGMKFRAFVAVHETIHHISFSLKTNAGDLYDAIFSDLTGLPRQSIAKSINGFLDGTPPSMERELITHLVRDDPNFDQEALILGMIAEDGQFKKMFSSFILAGQIYERVADAGTALYLLSNYADTADTEVYLTQLKDVRRANYIDIMHETSSSLSAAVKAYHKLNTSVAVIALEDGKKISRGKRLSVVDATLWAGDIVSHQTDLQIGLDQLAEQYHDQYFGVLSQIAPKVLPLFGQTIPIPSARVKERVAEVMEARAHVCSHDANLLDYLRIPRTGTPSPIKPTPP